MGRVASKRERWSERCEYSFGAGARTSRANARALLRTALCSSESVKSIMLVVELIYRIEDIRVKIYEYVQVSCNCTQCVFIA